MEHSETARWSATAVNGGEVLGIPTVHPLMHQTRLQRKDLTSQEHLDRVGDKSVAQLCPTI